MEQGGGKEKEQKLEVHKEEGRRRKRDWKNTRRREGKGRKTGRTQEGGKEKEERLEEPKEEGRKKEERLEEHKEEGRRRKRDWKNTRRKEGEGRETGRPQRGG